jgi:DNA/RNA-binding domain of Phe-tRNA-synthetase-like protein
VLDHGGQVADITDTLVIDPIPVPTNTLPADGAVIGTATPVISWDPVTDAGSYRIRIFEGQNRKIHDVNDLTGSTYTVPEGVLSMGSTYSYTVTAYRDGEAANLNNASLNRVFYSKRPHFTIDEDNAPVTDRILDNGEDGTSASGLWLSSGLQPSEGDDSMYSKEIGATYSYEIPLTGCYDIQMWWTEHPTRYNQVPVDIYDGDQLIQTVIVNQRTNGGQWNSLGVYEFTTSGRIVIRSESAAYSTCADAVRYVASDCQITDLIMDNGDPGTLPDGGWLPSGLQPSEGDDSLYTRQLGDSYTYEQALTGCYKISMWWPQHSSRHTDIPVQIYDGDQLVTEISINQQMNGGQWNLLTTHNFTSSAKVVIWSVSDTFATVADAVRFEASDCSLVFDRLEIQGQVAMDEGTSQTLELHVFYTNGTEETVPADSWNVDLAGADITAQGVLTAPSVDQDTLCTVTATYTDLGGTLRTDAFDVIVSDLTVTDLIMDNETERTSSTGLWMSSGLQPSEGDDSMYSKEIGATYTYEIPLTGCYDIQMWWTQHPTRYDQVPVDIYDGDQLLQTVIVNQRTNGGQWNSLGVYEFATSGRIVIRSESADYSTCADAVRYVASDCQIDDLIMDNGDPGTLPDGEWLPSGLQPSTGANSLYTRQLGASYTYEKVLTGCYKVSMWWPQHSSRHTDIPVEIYDGDQLVSEVIINQQMNGGQWNLLATHEFTTSAKVIIWSVSDTFATVADAVRFEAYDCSQEPVITDLTVDNAGPGTSSTGLWLTSGLQPSTGPDSEYSKQIGASYTYTAFLNGYYQVSVWWTAHPTRFDAVPVEIYDGDQQLSTEVVNQQAGGSQWNSLGFHAFTGTAKVVIHSESDTASTSADAVRFELDIRD